MAQLQAKLPVTPEIKPTIEQKKGEKKSSILPLLILASVSVVLFGLWTFLVIFLPKKGTAVQKLRTQGLSIHMSEQDKQLLTQNLKETEAERQKVIAAFPTETTLLEFISNIDSLRNSDVEVVRFSVDSDTPTKIGKNPRFLPMTLILRGQPNAVSRALDGIARSPYFIRTIIYVEDYDPTKGQVTAQTQFHLFVADAFTKTNP